MDLPHQRRAPVPFRPDPPVSNQHRRCRDPFAHVVFRIQHPEPPPAKLRLEAGRAGVHNDLRIPVPVQECVQVIRVFRVRFLPAPGCGIPVILPHDPEGSPVVPHIQENAGVYRAVVHGTEAAHIPERLFLLAPFRFIKRVFQVIPHGIDRTFGADPLPQDILAVKNARKTSGVAFPDFRGKGQVVIHGKMQPVHTDLIRPVNEVRLQEMIGAVRVAVQEDAASLHRTAADHLVNKGSGKQGRFIGIGAGGSHSLKLVLGIVLVRSEQVIAVPADDHLSLPALPFIGNTKGLQHGQHRAEHIPCQGSGGDAGHDEIPFPEAGQAP